MNLSWKYLQHIKVRSTPNMFVSTCYRLFKEGYKIQGYKIKPIVKLSGSSVIM